MVRTNLESTFNHPVSRFRFNTHTHTQKPTSAQQFRRHLVLCLRILHSFSRTQTQIHVTRAHGILIHPVGSRIAVGSVGTRSAVETGQQQQHVPQRVINHNPHARSCDCRAMIRLRRRRSGIATNRSYSSEFRLSLFHFRGQSWCSGFSAGSASTSCRAGNHAKKRRVCRHKGGECHSSGEKCQMEEFKSGWDAKRFPRSQNETPVSDNDRNQNIHNDDFTPRHSRQKK